MARDIGEWLEQLGLGEYAEAFVKNRIKFDHLADLSEDDLRELGVATMGDRKTLLRAIVALADESVEPAEMANGGPEGPPHRTTEAERPGHRRLADHILDAIDQAEGQDRSNIAEQLQRAHQMLIEQESIQHAHRRGVGDFRV